ncbi:MAG: ABC transporter ATP-binding protein, partial [Spirochaetales bacterium]|nr:ABC transporter ATP-binding protein [Spirochaetales bacterium]
LRILPDVGARIVEGSITIEGQDLLKLKEADMRKIRGNDISMIFQDPMTALNPVQRVGEQISEAVRLHSDMTKEQCDQRAKEMLKMVGITEDRFTEYPHQFSGGMKQRIVIAIALACNPKVLLADEPTTALDVTIQAQVLDLVAELQKKFNTSMLLITHDLGVVAQVCDDVAIIYAGQIVEYGTKEQIFHHPSHPYTVGLFGAIPDMAGDDEWLHPIEGLPPDPTKPIVGCPFAPRCKFASDKCFKEAPPTQKTPDGHESTCHNMEAVIKEGR